MIYPSIRIEGNIISQEILAKLEEGDYPGQLAKDFGFESRVKLRDEIAFAWATAKDYWRIFQRKLERLHENVTATSETRSDWMKPFLELLGYQIESSRAEIVNEKSYAISHRVNSLGGFPIHIMGYRDDLDKKRAEGGPRLSPHGLLQEYLNVTEHLFGLVSNGHYIRLLRDSGRLVKLSFAEFDLQRMMEDDLYADFAIMFRLIHRTRMPQNRELGAESLIERYHQDSLDAGSRIRERLSGAVEDSIIRLAKGFLQHPANNALNEAVDKKQLSAETYYEQLLRLIYRFLFLMVTEERDLIFPEATLTHRDVYYRYYSIQRLRKLAERRRYDESRFEDLWEGLKTSFRFYENRQYGEKLGILPLDGDLFGADALGLMAESKLNNDVLLECIHNLTEFENERGQRVSVNYGSLDVEEFGSVYEGLLEYDPAFTKIEDAWSFQFVKGDKRSSSGSHYTPEELVQPLIKHSLDYIIEEKLKACETFQDKEGARKAKRDALLSIKVCDVACGSGHILLSAARRIATVLSQVLTDEEQPSPTSFRTAIREVIRHCIYGVDKNPLAVELCKVALWLEAHNPGMPLTFLDHRIRCGDSIVGLARREEIEKGISQDAFKTLPGDDKSIAANLRKRNKDERDLRIEREVKLASATTEEARKAAPGIQATLEYQAGIVNELSALALKGAELDSQPDDTVEDFHRKREYYSTMRGTEYWRLKNIADLQVAQFFTPKTSEKKDSLATDATYFEVVENRHPSLGNCVYNSTAVSGQKKFFHWFIEFPEVFEQGGFDCILGNPPFLGNRSLSGTFGDNYLQYLRTAFVPIGAVDLVTYFFRRAFDVLASKGFQALLATNTIAQGDAREGGLDVIVQRGGTINYAVRSMRWPGSAAVEVAQVAIHKGAWRGQCVLGFKVVDQISAYLDGVEDVGKPFALRQNEEKSFQGSIVLGKGFILSPENANALIAKDARNKGVLFPYLNGDDLNARPDQSPSRWVINFFDWPLDRKAEGQWKGSSDREQTLWLRSGHVPKDYPQKVASDYHDCLEIVLRLVKPERTRKDEKGDFVLRKPLPQKWWIYADKRPALYRTISPLARVLVTARVTKYLKFTSTETGIVFADQLVILAESSADRFAFLNSSLFEHWSWKNCSTMGASTIRFGLTDAYETFPFLEKDFQQERLSLFLTDLSDVRIRAMNQMGIGLTQLYNLFHNPKLTAQIVQKESKQSQEISGRGYQDLIQLRQLHKEMDEAVLAAYGWSDLDLEHDFHEVEYLPENDRVRYTISEKARKEVLRRLLKLNHEIHEAEVKMGLWKEKKKVKAEKRAEIDQDSLREYVTLLVAQYAESAKRVYAVKLLMIAQICKAIELQFQWGLKTYGPYPGNQEFEQLLTNLGFHNLIEPESEFSQIGDKPIRLTEEGKRRIEELESRFPLKATKESVHQIVADFDPNKYGSREMELLGTLIYLHKEHFKENDKWGYEKLVVELRKEKPHFSKQTTEDALTKLIQMKYVDESVG